MDYFPQTSVWVGGGQPESVAIEGDSSLQVLDSEGDDGDSWLHDVLRKVMLQVATSPDESGGAQDMRTTCLPARFYGRDDPQAYLVRGGGTVAPTSDDFEVVMRRRFGDELGRVQVKRGRPAAQAEAG
jgi:hypothetical protein